MMLGTMEYYNKAAAEQAECGYAPSSESEGKRFPEPASQKSQSTRPTLRKPEGNPYDKKAKRYTALQKYFFNGRTLTFSKTDKPEEVKEKLSPKDSRVWLLFGKRGKHGRWESLQVGHSKNNVKSELEDVINFLFCKFDHTSQEFTNSAFYEKVCPQVSNGKDKRELLYSKIGSEYEDFRICFLDVDKYLGIEPNSNNKTDAERIVEICKNQYAEAKIAYETLAIYWNHYSSGIDGQTLDYIVKHLSEFQE